MSKKKKLLAATNAKDAAQEPGRELIEQADVWCREARLAARMKRLRAACGLFETAMSLLRRAVQLGGAIKNEATVLLAQITTEAAIYAELCRDTSHHQTPQPVRIRIEPPRN